MTLIGDAGIIWKAWEAIAETKFGKALRERFGEKTDVLLLGSTGAGKTQFLRSLADTIAPSIPMEARTEHAVLHPATIDGKRFVFRDVPGQRLHADRRREEIVTALKNRRTLIFLNVTCYGYHEFGASEKEVVDSSYILQGFLESNRKREVEILNEFSPFVSRETILTLVTKADIWWDNKEKVLEHYVDGEYARRIKILFPGATHIVRPYSSINKRFYRLERSHNFDDEQRTKLRTEVFRVLCEEG